MSKRISNAPGRARDPERAEDIRSVIQVCAQMFTTEQQKQWSAISAFIQLSLGLVVASFLPEQLTGANHPRLAQGAGVVLGVIGVAVSLFWWSFNKRSEKIQQYWLFSAREIESGRPKALHLFRRGGRFASGESVVVDGQNIKYQGIATWSTRAG